MCVACDTFCYRYFNEENERYLGEAIITRKRFDEGKTNELSGEIGDALPSVQSETGGDKEVENLCQRLVMPRIYGFDYRRAPRRARYGTRARAARFCMGKS